MAITYSFKNAVATNDVRGIRIMMKDSLLVDPTFIEFKEMEHLAQSVSGLFDPHDGRKFESNKFAWNDEYMNKLMVQAVGNFSRERISHLQEVVKYLRPVSTQSSVPKNGYVQFDKPNRKTHASYRNNNEQKNEDKHNKRVIYNRGTKILVGTAIGGVVGGAGAVIVGGSCFVGAAVGAAGGVLIGAVVANATNGGQ